MIVTEKLYNLISLQKNEDIITFLDVIILHALTYTVREEAKKAGMGGMELGHAMGSTLTTNPSKGLWYIGIDQKSPGAALERKM